MEAFLISTGLVALAEIGDKTQLLALLLAARFRAPAPILLGILVATLANHGVAAAAGSWIASLVSPGVLGWILGLSLLGLAVWTLVPDEAPESHEPKGPLGVFGVTFVAFFLAEMGDKTQIATVVLAARYHVFAAVVAGTTLGMLVANAPAVLIGHRMANRLPVVWIHRIAAALFAILGIATLIATGRGPA